jgi:hypothetical protein
MTRQGWENARYALGDLGSAMATYAGQNKKWARAAKAVSLSSAIIDTASAVMSALNTKPFYLGMINAGLAAATGAFQVATIQAQTFHKGGIIRAHNGLAVDEVPIIAQTGERVLSRAQNKAYEQGGGGGVQITINPIIQLWDANDVQRNKDLLVSAVSQAITNNAQIRQIMRQYA